MAKTTSNPKAAKPIGQAKAMEREVLFEMDAPVGSKVFVSGTFCAWRAHVHAMSEAGTPGHFSLRVKLSAGRYLYKFIVNDRWVVDPKNPRHEPDGHGGANNVLEA